LSDDADNSGELWSDFPADASIPLPMDVFIFTKWGESIETTISELTFSDQPWIWWERIGSDQYGFNVYAFRTEADPEQIQVGYSCAELLSLVDCAFGLGNGTIH
jgi:hypothetical protein